MTNQIFLTADMCQSVVSVNEQMQAGSFILTLQTNKNHITQRVNIDMSIDNTMWGLSAPLLSR